MLVEGEKDADSAATKLGLTTTTPPMGAKKWKTAYTETLRGRHVALVADVDKPDAKTGIVTGWEHVVEVANALSGIAASVRVVSLPPAETRA